MTENTSRLSTALADRYKIGGAGGGQLDGRIEGRGGEKRLMLGFHTSLQK